jgi:hypothetical protein
LNRWAFFKVAELLIQNSVMSAAKKRRSFHTVPSIVNTVSMP